MHPNEIHKITSPKKLKIPNISSSTFPIFRNNSYQHVSKNRQKKREKRRKEKKRIHSRNGSHEIPIIAVNPSIPFAIPSTRPHSWSPRKARDEQTTISRGNRRVKTSLLPFHTVKGGRAHRENNRAAPLSPPYLSCRFTPLALVETR